MDPATIAMIAGGSSGAAGSLLSSFLNVAQQKSLAKYQAKLNYKYAEKSARNTPTWNRAGLEKAGYNPMLAVQNATSGANSSWTSPQSVNDADIAGGISSGLANALSFKRLENETQQTNSTVKANEATARNQNAEASNKEAENPYISKREEANLGKLSAETSKLNRETQYFDALEENMIQERRLQELGINMNYNASIYGSNQAYNASTYTANMNNKYKTLSQYGGKWIEDKFKSLSGSKFGKDLAKLGRMIYRR